MATLVSPIPRSTVIWFGSLDFMSTGTGYDMILLSVKGPGNSRCTSTIEGPETASPPRLPAQEEAWTAPPPPLCGVAVIDTRQTSGGAAAGSPARRGYRYDGPVLRRPRNDIGR